MRTTYTPAQFGASPDRQVSRPAQGATRAVRELGQALVELNEAQTPKQAAKTTSKLTRNWIGLGFRLIGEGIGDVVRKCFR